MPESALFSQLDFTAMETNVNSSVVEAKDTTTSSPSEGSTCSDSPKPPRDSSWLQIEVCRDFQRDTCPHGEHCRFAHPESKIIGKEGKVTCCYDFLKDRCQREYCKYYHPPAHIKEKLVNAGKQFGAMMSCSSRYPSIPAVAVQPLVFPGHSSDGCSGVEAWGPIMSPYYHGYADRVHICPDFLLGRCHGLVCSLAHPGPHVYRNFDRTVTVCNDFMRGVCIKGDYCCFYHPLPHPFSVQPVYIPNQGFPVGQVPLVPAPVYSPPMLYPVGSSALCHTLTSSPVSMGNTTFSLMPSGPAVTTMLPTVLNPSLPSNLIPAQTVMSAPVTVIDSTIPTDSSDNELINKE